jgi:hypothetical protein
MNAKTQLNELDDALRGMRGLWLLMLLAPFGYLLAGLWLGPHLHPDWPWLAPALPALLVCGIGLGAVCAWAALLLRRGGLPGRPSRLVLKLAIRLQRNAGGSLLAAVAICQAALTLQLALAEAIALIGLALHLLGAPALTLLLFANASVALMILLRPRRLYLAKPS